MKFKFSPILLLFLVVSLLLSCASLRKIDLGYTDPYIATADDLYMIWATGTGFRGEPDEPYNFEYIFMPLLVPFYIVDLPFSIVTDTIYLPYDLYHLSDQEEECCGVNCEEGTSKEDGHINIKAEVPNGVVKEYYKDGTLHAEIEYEDGKLNGIFRTYYESGKRRAEMYHINDVPQWHKSYYESGELMGEGYYINGKREAMEREYYESGKVKGEFPYKNGLMHGVGNYYYESGKVESEQFYENDELQYIKRYDEDGNLLPECLK